MTKAEAIGGLGDVTKFLQTQSGDSVWQSVVYSGFCQWGT